MSIRSTGQTGAVALDAGLTPPFERRNLLQGRKAGDIKREPERRNFGTGEREDRDLHCHGDWTERS